MSESASPGPRKRGSRGPAPASETNLRDVARRAGVSPATASRVFSGTTAVREETRTKVLQAADELGYVVNGLAQAMMGIGRRPLALVAGDITNPSVVEMIGGAEQVASRNGHLFILASTQGEADREQAVIESLREQRTAGVLLACPAEAGKAAEERIARYAAALTPVGTSLVLCGHPSLPGLPGVPAVNYDHIGGVQELVRHLSDSGHNRIAFMGWSKTTTANQCFLGYSIGLKNAGLTIDSSLVIECPDEVIEAQLAALLLMNQPERPSAIICLTDRIALGVYRAARDLGVGIPGQLAVAGFYDSVYAANLAPSLTSIRVPCRQVGIRAAELALGIAADDTYADLPVEVVFRESTS